MEPVDRVRGREALIPRTLKLLRDRLPERVRWLRMGVVHIMCPEIAEELVARLERLFAPDEIMMRPATSCWPRTWDLAHGMCSIRPTSSLVDEARRGTNDRPVHSIKRW